MGKYFVKLTVGFVVAIFLFSSAKADEGGKGVGFESVAAALAFLKTKPTVTFNTTKPDGWLIANDSSPFTIWSFTPEKHYAHPAVVKRELKQNEQGDVYIQMSALCQAEKEACDRLMSEFEELNKQIVKNVRNKVSK